MKHVIAHPEGESTNGALVPVLGPVAVDTFGGRIHIEWDPLAPVTPLRQLPFFTEYLKVSGLFDPWVEECPLRWTSPNAPNKRDVLGTAILSILCGHRRYAHISALRGEDINAKLLGMSKVVSEDSVRGSLIKLEETKGIAWLQQHLQHVYAPLLGEPWILDADVTIKPLYGHQEGAQLGYNPHKPGCPSHIYHTFLIANLRLVLEVEVQAGNKHACKHSSPGLWALLERLGRENRPVFIRGDKDWGTEGNIARAEQEGLGYLFKLRLTAGVKKLVERLMRGAEWTEAGQCWQGAESELRLSGRSHKRRVVVLRRPLTKQLAIALGWQASGKVPVITTRSKQDNTQPISSWCCSTKGFIAWLQRGLHGYPKR